MEYFEDRRRNSAGVRHNRPNRVVVVFPMQRERFPSGGELEKEFIEMKRKFTQVAGGRMRARKTYTVYEHVAYFLDCRQRRVETERDHVKFDLTGIDTIGFLFDRNFGTPNELRII